MGKFSPYFLQGRGRKLTAFTGNRARISAESQHGPIAQVLKDRLFNTDLTAQPPMEPPAALMQQPDA
jgi:hypothetical protein